MKNNLLSRGSIIPILLGITALFLIVGGIYIYSHEKAEAPIVVNESEKVGSDNNQELTSIDTSKNINMKSFKLGTLEFSYPEILSFGALEKVNEGIVLSLFHSISFKHINSCDLKDGLSINDATDFSAEFKLYNTDLINSIKKDNPNGYTDMIKGNSVLIQAGFIDKYKIGSLDGYKISIGVEGCGYSTYYFPISVNETLVIRRDVYLQTLQMGREKLIDIPGFIPQTKEEQIFKDILYSVTGLDNYNQKTMSVKLYFPNSILNPDMIDCGLVYPVSRIIPYTQAVASATLAELIKGPTEEEKKNGYFGVIPVGTKVNSIKITEGILSIDFNSIVVGGGGSCGQVAKFNSFMTTLKQFSTVKDVQMTVLDKGNTEDIFQP